MQRRTFVSGSVAALTLLPIGHTFTQTSEPRRTLIAQTSTEPLVGMPYPHTPVWAFDGKVPGPEIRLRHGDRLSLDVINRLDVPTSVHWHGVRVPWAMDGVAGLTQTAIATNERFSVDFTPPDAGTYWYHAHANTPEQVGRGLYGPLVIEEKQPIAVDRELVWMLDDWRLTPEATIVEGFAQRHDASHGGRIGNTVTVNGRREWPVRVRSGERLRLRLVNAANARQFALDFGDLPVQIIAIDGQPVRPQTPDGAIVVPSAGRVDLVLDMLASPSSRHDVIDRYYRDTTIVGFLAVDSRSPLRLSPPDTPVDLGVPQLPEPNLRDAIDVDVVMTGGAMGGLRGASLEGRWLDMRELAAANRFWALNDLVANGYDTPPLVQAKRGQTIRLTFQNNTRFVHPMHLHGHHVKVLSIDGQPPPHDIWHDSVPVAPDQRIEVAFVADNPGRWLLHCHVLEHHMAGMGTIVEVT